MDQSYWKEQLRRHWMDALSTSERDALWHMLAQHQNKEEWEAIVAALLPELPDDDTVVQPNWEPAIRAILAREEEAVEATEMDETTVGGVGQGVVRPMRRLRRWLVAAAVLILIGGAYLLFRNYSFKQDHVAQGPVIHDVRPGGNRAILTLSGGQQVVLDSAHNGMLAQQGNSQVAKTGNGQLRYDVMKTTAGGTATQTGGAAGSASGAVLYNTLSTPRGGQYQLTLPDGTQVWLNAASSITYPTVFAGVDRKVTITGEAYLEVAKDAGHPFKVEAGGVLVNVLGTSFNINVYRDEPQARTTLLTGAVSVASIGKSAGKPFVLQPGQQAVSAGELIKVQRDVDVEAVVAWKNGTFQFEGADLFTVMRELARWYDVDVVYQPGVKPLRIGGAIKRDLNLSEIVHFLAGLGVHCSIDNKKLIVQP